jgi:hypothetical protein
MIFRPGHLAGINLFGTFGNDPYDLSVCWPNYRPEADQIVGRIRTAIGIVQQANPAQAQALDQELIALLQKFRNTNSCPNISEGTHQSTEELKNFINKAESAAQQAQTQAAQMKQQAAQTAQALPAQAKAAPMAMKSAEDMAREEAEAAKLQAELMKLEAEQAQVENIVTAPPTLPSPSSYTGSPAPVTTTRRASTAPTAEQKLASLVETYQTKKAMQRATVPAIRTVPVPPPAQTAAAIRTVPASQPAQPASAPPVSSPEEIPQKITQGVKGVFSWLQNTLFGTSTNLGGFGQAEQNSNKVISVIVIIGILFLLYKSKA